MSIDDEGDYYSQLGCSETSTAEQITAEFRERARRYHPDKFSNVEEKTAAEESFKKLEQARDVLLNHRALYDQWRGGGFAKFGITFNQWLKQPALHSSMHWEQPRQRVLPLTGQEGPQLPQTRGTGASTTTLQEFRRGSAEKPSSLLSKFRNNEDLT